MKFDPANPALRLWYGFFLLVALAALVGCQALVSNQQSPGGVQLTATPASINLGSVELGTSQTSTGRLANTGQSSVTIAQLTVAGNGYSVSGLTPQSTVAAGQSVNFKVQFAPASAGAANGNIAISTSSGTMNVTLSAMGVKPGDLVTGPTGMNFGNVVVGDAVSQPETVTNNGGVSVTITAVTLPTSAFSISGLALPLTLGPNQSSNFSVSFAPTAAGSSGGNLALSVDGEASPVKIALSGAGILPANVTANPASLTFTNVPVGQSSTQSETLQNTGGVNAQISQLSVSGAGFSTSGISLPVTLVPGQTVSFSVKFTPQSAGSSTGGVSVASDADDPNLGIGLTGLGVGSAQSTLSVTSPISVGNVVEGLSGTQTGTLTASGASVVVSSVSLGGSNPAEFSVTGVPFPVTVNPGQPVSFTVTFTPGAVGPGSAAASFASNASNSPAVATLTGPGAAAPAHSVQLSWAPSAGEGITRYNIYRADFGTGSCGPYTNIGSTTASVTTYTDNSVSAGAAYCYAATAVDASGESVYSNIADATVPSP